MNKAFGIALPIKTLLIEDNPGDVLLVKEAMRVADDGWFDLKHTERLSSGIEEYSQWKPHVIIADLSLPDSFGLDTVISLRKRIQDIPIIVLTVRDEEELGRDAITNGAQDYLVKGEISGQILKRSVLYAIERNRFRVELENSNQNLKDFAAIASHDLKEPLRKVISFGELLSKRSKDTLDSKGQDYLRRMLEATYRMQEYIDSLLDFSNVMTQSQGIQETDLRKVILDVVSDLDMLVKEKKARIEVNPLPSIEADPFQMRQLFLNLIGNAMKFSIDGQPPVIDISSRPIGSDSVEIRVTDNGIGFGAQNLDRIFKPFERLHGHGKYKGSGMGLAICQKIISRHGGNITAASEPKKGTSFVITLPKKQAHDFEE